MGNYGVKLSKKGYDIKAAADTQVVFSSSFNALKINSKATYTFTDTGTGTTIDLLTHSLGYVPFFFFVVLNSSGRYVYPSILYSKGIRADTTKVKWYTNGDGLGSVTILLIVFRNRMLTSYTAPIVQQTLTGSGSNTSDYGLKLSQTGQSVVNGSKDKMVLRSSDTEWPIHLVQAGSLDGTHPVSMTHNLGYLPVTLWYITLTAWTTPAYALATGDADDQSSIASTTQSGLMAPAGNYAGMVLKDPLLTNV